MERILDTGKITDNIEMTVNGYYPSYLISGRENLLIDTGLTISGPVLEQYLAENDKEGLNYNLLTHSHFDHLGATPYLKRLFPGMKIGGHKRIEKVLQNERAVKLIQSLNRDVETQFGADKAFLGKDIGFSAFSLDMKLKDGDKIELGDVTVIVIETPGHTRDSLSFYVPEREALFFGEAGGVPDIEGNIQPEFLVDYAMYIESIKKMMNIPVSIIGLAHGGVIKGRDARNYLKDSLEVSEVFKDRIERYLQTHDNSSEMVIEQIYNEDYMTGKIGQPARAYLLNLEAMVKAVKKAATTQ